MRWIWVFLLSPVSLIAQSEFRDWFQIEGQSKQYVKIIRIEDDIIYFRIPTDSIQKERRVNKKVLKEYNQFDLSELPYPTNEAGKIIFTDVVKTDNATQKQLYLSAKSWFANIFKSSQDVLQIDSKEDGILLGKGFADISIPVFLTDAINKLWFTIKIELKEGKYRYSIYDISREAYPSQYNSNPSSFTLEEIERNNYNPMFEKKWKRVTLEHIFNLIDSMKIQIQKGVIQSTSDW